MSSSPSSTESAVSTSASSPPPAAPAPLAPPTPEVVAKRKRKLQAPAPCWGQELCPNLVCPVVSGGKGAFREHFCERCRLEDLSVVTSRVYLPIIEVPPNSRTTGFWNEEPARPARCARIWWPAHRVCNQTSDSVGPRLVILRDDYATPPPGLAL